MRGVKKTMYWKYSNIISIFIISLCLALATSCGSEQYIDKKGTVHAVLTPGKGTEESMPAQTKSSEEQLDQPTEQVQMAVTQKQQAGTQALQIVQSQTGTKQDENPVNSSTAVPATKTADPGKAAEADKLYEQGFQVFLTFKYDEAIKLFDRALSQDPGCYKAYNGKGIALCYKGSYKEGMQLIDKALSIKPDFPYANFNKALGYKLMKDYKNAMIWFDKAISYDSKNTWSYFGIACIYAEWKDEGKAVEYLKKAIETDPGVKEVARRERDLDPIRTDPEFIKLLQ